MVGMVLKRVKRRDALGGTMSVLKIALPNMLRGPRPKHGTLREILCGGCGTIVRLGKIGLEGF